MYRTFAIIIFFLAVSTYAFAEKGLSIKAVRHFSYPTFTRIVFEIESAAPYVLTRSEDGKALIFSAYEGTLSLSGPLPKIDDGVVQSLELKKDEARPYVIVKLDAGAGEAKDFVLRNPDRIVLDISRAQTAAPPPPAAVRTVVIDPGHGGKDNGLVSGHGVEKSVALDLARGLDRLLRKHDPGLKVVLTRDKDTGLTLDERAAIANRANAVAFVSIHACAGKDIRVYTIGLGHDEQAAQPAPPRDFLGFDAESELKKSIWGSQQSSHLRESISLGRNVSGQIIGKPADPIQAPLAVLAPVDAPAVMIEIGMQSDRSKAAAAIAKGIEQYVKEGR